MLAVVPSPLALIPHFTKLDELLKRLKQKPAQPHAFTLPPTSDAIHRIIPITIANQRKAVTAYGQASIKR